MPIFIADCVVRICRSKMRKHTFIRAIVCNLTMLAVADGICDADRGNPGKTCGRGKFLSFPEIDIRSIIAEGHISNGNIRVIFTNLYTIFTVFNGAAIQLEVIRAIFSADRGGFITANRASVHFNCSVRNSIVITYRAIVNNRSLMDFQRCTIIADALPSYCCFRYGNSCPIEGQGSTIALPKHGMCTDRCFICSAVKCNGSPILTYDQIQVSSSFHCMPIAIYRETTISYYNKSAGLSVAIRYRLLHSDITLQIYCNVPSQRRDENISTCIGTTFQIVNA